MTDRDPLRTLAQIADTRRMESSGVHKLTERQKDILRLLLEGHDAKSAARQLSISVHTINEHLREARRTLAVSNSREAARLLREAEGQTPNQLRPNRMGVAHPASGGSLLGEITPKRGVAFTGVMMMMILAAAFMATLLSEREGASPLNASPRVVSTKPAAGDIIKPGAFTLEVTFDRPMMDGSYSFVQVSPATYPRCAPRPQLTPDARTFKLQCAAEPSRTYEVWFNRAPYTHFKSLSGAAARPFQLRFRAAPR